MESGLFIWESPCFNERRDEWSDEDWEWDDADDGD